MSDTKFTPGPWQVEVTADCTVIVSPKYWVCTMASGNSQAESALIAAAPDLYAALDAINQYWKAGNVSREPALWDAMESAIKKARGES